MATSKDILKPIFKFIGSAFKQPTFLPKQFTGQPWIFWGDENLYPQYLIGLTNGSSLHGQIINDKRNDIMGDGISYEQTNTIKDSETQKFINKCNSEGETLTEVMDKCVLDLVLFGGFALKILKNAKGTYISEIQHVDMSNLRASDYNEEGKIGSYWVSANWYRWSEARYKPKEYPTYSEANSEPVSILYFKPYYSGFEFYPVAPYKHAISAINLDVELGNQGLANLKNGMFPGMWIDIQSQIADPIKRKSYIKQLIDSLSGTDNTGKNFVTENDGKNKVNITPIQSNDLGAQYTNLYQSVNQNILSGHGISSPMLVGIKTEGQLGGNSEIANAYQLYYNKNIKPTQNKLLSQFNYIMKYNNFNTIEISNNAPIKFIFSESVIEKLLTQDEMREVIGYLPLDNSQTNVDQTQQ